MYTLNLTNEIDTQSGTFQTMQSGDTFREKVYGREKIVRQKEICRFRRILPDQSKTVFPAKLQKLGWVVS
jgi:queuine/archaeosine tRNA-ribosyltransferase